MGSDLSNQNKINMIASKMGVKNPYNPCFLAQKMKK